MILKVQLQGARPYEVGDEMWHESLAAAIVAEAEMIGGYRGNELLDSPDERAHGAGEVRSSPRCRQRSGDQYRAPDGVLYSLLEEPRTIQRLVKVS
jgi:hypothetical protein